MNLTIHNPILPGFYPDPSICRVGEDYYLINSTFEFFPGLPIFHSRDLAHWRQIGHVLTRPSQLDLDGVRASGGLYAPTLRYHQGTFYVINTMIDGGARSGNFIVTAPDILGPWSEPHWLEDAPGIDPSLLFDDDGRVWYVGNRHVDSYPGHCEIWLQELDLERWQLVGKKQVLWDGALKRAQWAEGPHIYKINGMYYLLIAEGGTGHEHAVTIARSSTITGPYEPNPCNPILTHRHLGRGYPIVGTGHADLVETPAGEWFLVCLAMRPYDGYFYNLGRETFLAPVAWEDGWPVVNPGVGKIEFETRGPSLQAHPWPIPPACDSFEAAELDLCWNFLRTPRSPFYSLSERPGFLRLRLRPETLADRANPSFIGRRQQHIRFTARTAMEFHPKGRNECAGLVLLQNDSYHFRLTLTRDPEPCVQLVERRAGVEKLIAHAALNAERVYLKVEAAGQRYSFYAADQVESWIELAHDMDGRILSTPVAGGFTGAYLGMYASSNGTESDNYADFDWFEYQGA